MESPIDCFFSIDLYLPFMSGKTLHLRFFDSDISISNADEEFIIPEDLTDGNDEWFTRLSALEISQDDLFSYDLFWPHLVLSSRGNLLTYVILYDKLRDHIVDENITKIITYDLEKGYRLVADDLGEKYHIDVKHNLNKSEYSSLISNILLRSSVISLFADQIITVIKQKFTLSNNVYHNKPLFLPFPNRYESMLPIIRNLNQPSNIIVTPLTISWRLLNPVEDWPETPHSRTLTEFANISTTCKQLHTLFQLQKEVFTGNIEISKKLDSELRNEYEVSLPQTIEYVCQNTIYRDIRLILSLHLIENALREIEPNKTIVGAMNPRDRYALEIGEKIDSDLYYIPHSIAYRHHILPQIGDTTYFVAGKADEQILNDTYSEVDIPNIKPVGRPFLDNLISMDTQNEKSSTEDNIVIGTQPYDDWIRKKFIIDVLEAIETIEYGGNTIIKIHPSESPDFYEELISKDTYDIEINIEQGNIEQYVNHSTTLITINSNVGIEGILLGAFCISYNPFEPFTEPSSYIDGESVPYLTTSSELQTKLESYILEKDVDQSNQKEYIQQSYSIGNSVNDLSDCILFDS